ncbi:MAG TPA: flagellar hook-basal body complex protein FliE [Rhodanobacteraceae bacterium]|nr:flagellar hook-basal body complex protein FliE [Rhodanobacteraceae bacterium]
MSAVNMQGVLQQMRALAAQVADAPKPAATIGAGTGGFSQALTASLDKINDLQQVATGEANAFQAGKPGVALYNVMIDQQEASLALQMGVQTRNRLVDAYKQIMNMQV